MRDISLHLMDIMQNSTSAGAANITIEFGTSEGGGKLSMKITDDGKGMDSELLARVTDPFSTTRTTRKVGLGIPLLKASSEGAGGYFRIDSAPGKGTVVEATFETTNIDRPPLGDIAGTVTGCIIANPGIDYVMVFKKGDDNCSLDTKDIKQRLGEVPINEFAVIDWINEYLNEGISNIFGGILDEIVSSA